VLERTDFVPELAKAAQDKRLAAPNRQKSIISPLSAGMSKS
jgi:hypothetical protein